MRLKCVKLAGFKSYVDPTVIELPANVTALVGPNGCGKSNIVDAIRLGVGESQAGLLRGNELTDFIFDGTATRAPAGQANVELIFDNEDHSLGGAYANYTEISLKREIRPDEPSKFFINGSRCRKKDIQDLFLGSGFGSRSFSVIQQGFIGRIVTAKPDELRLHLEEVAGVSKYRDRRRETERKIEATTENLERIKDHAAELSKQISYLQRQAREAARYSDLKERERNLQASLIALRVLAVDEQLNAQAERMRESTLLYDQEFAKLQSIRTALDVLRQQETEHLDQFNDVQGESFEARASLARTEEESRQRKQRREELEKEIRDATRTKSEEEGKLANRETELETLRNALRQLDQKRKISAKRCDKARAEHSRHQTVVDSWQQEWNAFLQELNASSSELSRQKEQVTQVQQEIAAVESRDTELETILRESKDYEDLTPLNEQKTALELAFNAESKRGSDLDEALEELEQLGNNDESNRRSLERELGEIRDRRSALTALVEQSLRKDSSSNNTTLAPMVELQTQPRVGELIDVKSGYEKAVEVVLGSYLHAITVKQIDFKKSSLEDLQDSNATLVSASSDTNSDSKLADVVTKGREWVSELCSQVYVDESLDAALERRKSFLAHESTVTKSGIWIGQSWIKFNGVSNGSSTLLRNRVELEEVQELYTKKEKQYNDTLKIVLDRTQKRTTLLAERRQVQERQNELNSQIASLSSDIEQQKAAQYQTRVTLANAQQEREANRNRKAALFDRANQYQSSLAELEEKYVTLEATQDHLETKGTAATNALKQALLEDRSAQTEYHELNLEYNNTHTKISSFGLGTELLKNSVSNIDRRLEALSKQVQSDEESAQSLAKKLEDAVARAALVEEKLTVVRKERDAVVNEIREQNIAETKQQQEVDRQQQSKLVLREREVQLNAHREHLARELTNLGFDVPTAKNQLDPGANEDSINRSLIRTQNRIEKLGAVNLAAAQDLDRRKEEYETYESRITDLEVSQDTLQQAMQKIDSETVALFNDVFTKANDRFQSVFTRLFGGGRATLVLTEDDPLTAGVIMRVQPPGKQIKNMQQLSDGERALAALAFTFAMFELNPSPICILDEVDAPLDTHNVSRFGKLLHSMANEVQFLIITHSRGTMNVAESLIGITMQEAGVSRVVSVELE